jgi:hypothetical protein
MSKLGGWLATVFTIECGAIKQQCHHQQKPPIEDLSAGDRSDSLLVNSLALLMAASTSIESIFTQCP